MTQAVNLNSWTFSNSWRSLAASTNSGRAVVADGCAW